jgi:UPF0755 protein
MSRKRAERSAAQPPEGAPPAAPARSLRWSGLALAVMLLLVPVMVAVHWLHYVSSPIPGLDAPVTVDIPDGAGFGGAVKVLRDRKLVHNLEYFKLLARLEGADKALRPGVYKIPAKATPRELLERLTQGEDVSDLVTLPEGWTMYHIADRLEAAGVVERGVFLERATSKELLRKLDIPGGSVEGYLFPDTYHFAPGISADAVIERMVRRHRQVWQDLENEVGPDKLQALLETHKLSKRDLLILASIVEREAVEDEERPIIARVFFNRLDKGMKLQADPTCTYGPKLYKQKASPANCKDPKSRTSTYVIQGLPPTPISNPGRASLRAVFEPTERPDERDYLYFVARPDGRRHTFSKTYKEHNEAIPR